MRNWYRQLSGMQLIVMGSMWGIIGGLLPSELAPNKIASGILSIVFAIMGLIVVWLGFGKIFKNEDGK